MDPDPGPGGALLGYARVSTAGQGLDAQRDRLREAGAVRIFEDVISGTIRQRDGLMALLDYARAGDSLVVVRLDRLGRSLRELIESVATLKDRHINLVSLEERIDTNSATGELVFHVFGAIAQFERRLISERTKDGLRTARKQGRVPGRPAVSERAAQDLRDLVARGTSVTQAARYVGIGRSTAYRVLQDTHM